jgi:hypothetical protein
MWNKLRIHLEAKHTPFVSKGHSFFARKEQEIKQWQLNTPSIRVTYTVQQVHVASCRIAW